MTLQEVMKQLKACGTEQNRKTWGRYGIKGEMFGVSFANMYKFQKQIKVDQELAEQLWATGNYDAQVLATLVADPNAMTDKQFEECPTSISIRISNLSKAAFTNRRTGCATR